MQIKLNVRASGHDQLKFTLDDGVSDKMKLLPWRNDSDCTYYESHIIKAGVTVRFGEETLPKLCNLLRRAPNGIDVSVDAITKCGRITLSVVKGSLVATHKPHGKLQLHEGLFVLEAMGTVLTQSTVMPSGPNKYRLATDGLYVDMYLLEPIADNESFVVYLPEPLITLEHMALVVDTSDGECSVITRILNPITHLPSLDPIP